MFSQITQKKKKKEKQRKKTNHGHTSLTGTDHSNDHYICFLEIFFLRKRTIQFFFSEKGLLLFLSLRVVFWMNDTFHLEHHFHEHLRTTGSERSRSSVWYFPSQQLLVQSQK